MGEARSLATTAETLTLPLEQVGRRREPPASGAAEVDGFPEWLDHGRYRRENRLGRGGMGVVYSYRDPKLDRLVAVKAIPRERSTDRRWREQFLLEARVLAALDHPNIAGIHHVAEHQGADYLILEYVPGVTLDEVIGGRALPAGRALSITLQIGRAIRAGWDAGVIHCDVKPGNVMVAQGDVVKLLDFGLSRHIAGSGAQTDSPPGTRYGWGTPGYMSPEQVLGQTVDRRTDVWGFGCVLFECVTGRPAFPGRSREERDEATLSRDPEWSLLPPDAPPLLHRLLRDCLCRNAEQRLSAIESACSIIEELLAVWTIERAAPGRPNNLPAPLTSYVPRPGEIERMRAMLATNRLLTLTGGGGCGKTRLALALARALLVAPDVPSTSCLDDGIWFVELASLPSDSLVAQAIGAAVRGPRKLEAGHGQSIESALLGGLRESRMLLVLDNCERLAEGCAALLRTLLPACPGLRVVATSREELRVPGEQVYRVPELSYPEPGAAADPERFEAVQLFLVRAALSLPGFAITPANSEHVAAICVGLEGHPLAIELAAARLRSLPVDQIAARLLEVVGSAPIMEASIASSVELLSAAERELLGRLSAFSGGWTLEAAEAICGDRGQPLVSHRPIIELLGQLVNRSLVLYEVRADRARYHLLEMVREYVRRHLHKARRAGALEQRHFEWFLRLAREADENVNGPGQAAWLERLETEHDNLRSALAFAGESTRSPDAEAELAKAISEFWRIRGYLAEGWQWITHAINRRGEVEDVLQIRLLNAAGTLAGRLGRLAEGEERYGAALRIARRLGDRRREAGILTNLGTHVQRANDLDRACEFHRSAMDVYRQLGDDTGVAMVQLNLGDVLMLQGHDEEARQLFESCLPLFRRCGDKQRIAAAVHNLGQIAVRRRDLDVAGQRLRECLVLFRDLRYRPTAGEGLAGLGIVAVLGGDSDRASCLLGAADAVRESVGGHFPAPIAAEYDAAQRAARRNLGQEAFARTWGHGAAMTFEEAIDFAINADAGRVPVASPETTQGRS